MLFARGVLLGSSRYRVELFNHDCRDSQCLGCLKFGHIGDNCQTPKLLRSRFCGQHHASEDHKCGMVGCSTPKGLPCQLSKESARCVTCKGNHYTNACSCPSRLGGFALARQGRQTSSSSDQASPAANGSQPDLDVSSTESDGPVECSATERT